MTETITIPQSTIDSLSAGTYTLTIEASAGEFSTSQSVEFVTWNKPSITIPTLGEYNTAFSFDMVISGINGEALVIGTIDGVEFYRLNYAKDGTYTINITEDMMLGMAGGTHTLVFSLEDSQHKTATVSGSFIRTSTVPVVAVKSNVGNKSSAFSISYTVKNASREHPELVAYMDSTATPIITIPDASTANSITIDNTLFNSLSLGSHTVIIAVTNTIGTTTKNVSFNKTKASANPIALKLTYSDDTWDGGLENRIYSEMEVEYEGQQYMSYIDETPYSTEGDKVTGVMLASFSRGIQNALASNTVLNSDGSMTENSSNGTSVITETADGYTEVYTDKEGNTLTKNVFFNSDGSIAESTSFSRRN